MTLTATVVIANGSRPAGSVQFETGGTAIGSPVAVNASGQATTTSTFASSGPQSLTAVFTPTSARVKSSAGTLALTVKAASTGVTGQGSIPLAVAVPAAGTFTLTVDTADPVTLAVSASRATAVTTPVVVSDTRNTFPGWSVSGQGTDWTGSGTAAGAVIPANQLGWAPASTGALPAGVTLGAPVAPASPGLGGAPATLASASAGAGSGFGTSTLDATLTLLIPQSQAPGPYTAGLTITAVSSAGGS